MILSPSLLPVCNTVKCALGLFQNHQIPNGFGNSQKETGEQLLLECQRVHSGLQHNVYQLLCVQQAWRGCGFDGSNPGKAFPHQGGSDAQR